MPRRAGRQAGGDGECSTLRRPDVSELLLLNSGKRRRVDWHGEEANGAGEEESEGKLEAAL